MESDFHLFDTADDDFCDAVKAAGGPYIPLSVNRRRFSPPVEGILSRQAARRGFKSRFWLTADGFQRLGVALAPGEQGVSLGLNGTGPINVFNFADVEETDLHFFLLAFPIPQEYEERSRHVVLFRSRWRDFQEPAIQRCLQTHMKPLASRLRKASRRGSTLHSLGLHTEAQRCADAAIDAFLSEPSGLLPPKRWIEEAVVKLRHMALHPTARAISAIPLTMVTYMFNVDQALNSASLNEMLLRGTFFGRAFVE